MPVPPLPHDSGFPFVSINARVIYFLPFVQRSAACCLVYFLPPPEPLLPDGSERLFWRTRCRPTFAFAAFTVPCPLTFKLLYVVLRLYLPTTAITYTAVTLPALLFCVLFGLVLFPTAAHAYICYVVICTLTLLLPFLFAKTVYLPVAPLLFFHTPPDPFIPIQLIRLACATCRFYCSLAIPRPVSDFLL